MKSRYCFLSLGKDNMSLNLPINLRDEYMLITLSAPEKNSLVHLYELRGNDGGTELRLIEFVRGEKKVIPIQSVEIGYTGKTPLSDMVDYFSTHTFRVIRHLLGYDYDKCGHLPLSILITYSRRDIMNLPRAGKVAVDEIERVLHRTGLHLRRF